MMPIKEDPAGECYCCSCWTFVPNTTGLKNAVEHWDYACRNHGAHGVRACDDHGRRPVVCDGCDSGCPGRLPMNLRHKSREGLVWGPAQ